MPTGIEWTDETWNPATGCDIVSPGCANCYAKTRAEQLKEMGQPAYQRDGDPKTSGPGFGLTIHEDRLEQPLRWKKPRMVFVNSMSDLFHEDLPDLFIDRVFDVMTLARQHTFQVLTKRPERAREFLLAYYNLDERARELEIPDDTEPLPNVWIGVSIENSRYTWRADVLREVPAAIRFVSAEPLIGSLFSHPGYDECNCVVPALDGHGQHSPSCSIFKSKTKPLDLKDIDWLIVGGESGGKHVRPMHPDWARELRDACLEGRTVREFSVDSVMFEGWVGTAFFFKQWGSWAPGEGDYSGSSLTGDRRTIREGILLDRDGRRRDTNELSTFRLPDRWERMAFAGARPKSGGKSLDGREWCEFPVTGQLAIA